MQLQETTIIPRPASIRYGHGSRTLSASTGLAAIGDAAPVADLVREVIGVPTGLPLPATQPTSPDAIVLRIDPTLTGVGTEGYRIEVGANGMRLIAATQQGLRLAVQTFRQLLPVKAFSPEPVPGAYWEVPYVEIEDSPRFRWRGVMLDVARWWLPPEFLHRMVDLLALHRFNRLHLHLTDDQGWRMQIDRYPLLTSIGAWRTESMRGHLRDQAYDGRPHGGFYTKDELRALVRYAAARGITVVPEIDLPGHTRAAIAAYPELGNQPHAPLPVASTWGIHEHVLNAEPATIEFFRHVLDEVIEIFPSEFVHIGGDECPTTQWTSSPRAQERARELGLPGAEALQGWFISQLASFLATRGRRIIGWDEIVQSGLPSGATVMSWQGEEGGIAAARAGHDAIMCPADWTYLDFYQADPATEPTAIGGLLTLERAYTYQPVPDALSESARAHILGVQSQLWTEYMPTPGHIEYMAFPRLCALAEVSWGTAGDFAEFRQRLSSHLERLDALGVGYRPL